MDLQLTGKIAAVTGGSRGIGKAAATALAAEGADLALIARNLSVAENTAREIAEACGRTVRAYGADTGDDHQVNAAFEAIGGDFGRLDILVNAAAQPGGHAPPPKLMEITDDAFWADMNVKVMGYLRCARAAAPYMLKEGWGRIINISGLAARSTGSIIGSMRNVSVAALTKNLADELGPHGINVTCVHPGITRTEKTAALVLRRAEAAGVSAEEIERRMAETSTIGRLVTAEEVAYIIAFLASPRAVAIAGDAIAVGGGAPGAIYY